MVQKRGKTHFSDISCGITVLKNNDKLRGGGIVEDEPDYVRQIIQESYNKLKREAEKREGWRTAPIQFQS